MPWACLAGSAALSRPAVPLVPQLAEPGRRRNTGRLLVKPVVAFSPPPAQKKGIILQEKAPVHRRLFSYCLIRWWHLKIKYEISFILVHLAFTDVPYAWKQSESLP